MSGSSPPPIQPRDADRDTVAMAMAMAVGDNHTHDDSESQAYEEEPTITDIEREQIIRAIQPSHTYSSDDHTNSSHVVAPPPNSLFSAPIPVAGERVDRPNAVALARVPLERQHSSSSSSNGVDELDYEVRRVMGQTSSYGSYDSISSSSNNNSFNHNTNTNGNISINNNLISPPRLVDSSSKSDAAVSPRTKSHRLQLQHQHHPHPPPVDTHTPVDSHTPVGFPSPLQTPKLRASYSTGNYLDIVPTISTRPRAGSGASSSAVVASSRPSSSTSIVGVGLSKKISIGGPVPSPTHYYRPFPSTFDSTGGGGGGLTPKLGGQHKAGVKHVVGTPRHGIQYRRLDQSSATTPLTPTTPSRNSISRGGLTGLGGHGHRGGSGTFNFSCPSPIVGPTTLTPTLAAAVAVAAPSSPLMPSVAIGTGVIVLGSNFTADPLEPAPTHSSRRHTMQQQIHQQKPSSPPSTTTTLAQQPQPHLHHSHPHPHSPPHDPINTIQRRREPPPPIITGGGKGPDTSTHTTNTKATSTTTILPTSTAAAASAVSSVTVSDSDPTRSAIISDSTQPTQQQSQQQQPPQPPPSSSSSLHPSRRVPQLQLPPMNARSKKKATSSPSPSNINTPHDTLLPTTPTTSSLDSTPQPHTSLTFQLPLSSSPRSPGSGGAGSRRSSHQSHSPHHGGAGRPSLNHLQIPVSPSAPPVSPGGGITNRPTMAFPSPHSGGSRPMAQRQPEGSPVLQPSRRQKMEPLEAETDGTNQNESAPFSYPIVDTRSNHALNLVLSTLGGSASSDAATGADGGASSSSYSTAASASPRLSPTAAMHAAKLRMLLMRDMIEPNYSVIKEETNSYLGSSLNRSSRTITQSKSPFPYDDPSTLSPNFGRSGLSVGGGVGTKLPGTRKTSSGTPRLLQWSSQKDSKSLQTPISPRDALGSSARDSGRDGSTISASNDKLSESHFLDEFDPGAHMRLRHVLPSDYRKVGDGSMVGIGSGGIGQKGDGTKGAFGKGAGGDRTGDGGGGTEKSTTQRGHSTPSGVGRRLSDDYSTYKQKKLAAKQQLKFAQRMQYQHALTSTTLSNGLKGSYGGGGGGTFQDSSNMPWFFIHPSSKLYRLWKFVLLIVTWYTCFETSFVVGFDLVANFTKDIFPTLVILNIFTDAIMLGDMFVELRKGYYDETLELHTSARSIRLRYVKHWFMIDLLASMPMEFIQCIILASTEGGDGDDDDSENGLVYSIGFQLLKLPRLLKILKVLQHISSEEVQRQSLLMNESLRACFAFVYLVLIGHLVGCGWFLTSRICLINDPQTMTWVQSSQIVDEDRMTQYVESIYWSMATLFNIGFGGEGGATNMYERIYTLFVVVFAALAYAQVLGNFMLVIENINRSNVHTEMSLTLIQDYMSRQHFTPELKKKVLDFQMTTSAYLNVHIGKHVYLRPEEEQTYRRRKQEERIRTLMRHETRRQQRKHRAAVEAEERERQAAAAAAASASSHAVGSSDSLPPLSLDGPPTDTNGIRPTPPPLPGSEAWLDGVLEDYDDADDERQGSALSMISGPVLGGLVVPTQGNASAASTTIHERSEDRILSTLPPCYNLEIMLHLHGKLIYNIFLFRDLNSAILSALTKELHTRIYVRDDYVVKKKLLGRRMYLVKYGSVEQIEFSDIAKRVALQAKRQREEQKRKEAKEVELSSLSSHPPSSLSARLQRLRAKILRTSRNSYNTNYNNTASLSDAPSSGGAIVGSAGGGVAPLASAAKPSIKVYHDGYHFGESSFLHGWFDQTIRISSGVAELCLLEYSSFLKISEAFPEFARCIITSVERREETERIRHAREETTKQADANQQLQAELERKKRRNNNNQQQHKKRTSLEQQIHGDETQRSPLQRFGEMEEKDHENRNTNNIHNNDDNHNNNTHALSEAAILSAASASSLESKTDVPSPPPAMSDVPNRGDLHLPSNDRSLRSSRPSSSAAPVADAVHHGRSILASIAGAGSGNGDTGDIRPLAPSADPLHSPRRLYRADDGDIADSGVGETHDHERKINIDDDIRSAAIASSEPNQATSEEKKVDTDDGTRTNQKEISN